MGRESAIQLAANKTGIGENFQAQLVFKICLRGCIEDGGLSRVQNKSVKDITQLSTL